MRKIIASTFVSLDGVMQAPGGRSRSHRNDSTRKLCAVEKVISFQQLLSSMSLPETLNAHLLPECWGSSRTVPIRTGCAPRRSFYQVSRTSECH